MKTNYILALILFNTTSVAAQQVEFKQFFTPFDTATNHYGTSLTFEGSFFAVGSEINNTNENGNNSLSHSGAVYAYKYGSFQWDFMQKIVAADRSSEELFGSSITFVGSEIIVGAESADEFVSSKVNVGAVYVFEQISKIWTEKQKILASDRIENDGFGNVVKGFGDALFIQSHSQSYDENGQNYIQGTGAVYYFKKESGTWVEKQKIVAPDRADINEVFGNSITYNNTNLFIGSASASDETGLNPVSYSGAVYIYEKNGNGEWVFIQKIKASDAKSNDAFGSFGMDLFGNMLIVGSGSGFDESGGNFITNSGAVYYFKKNITNGQWEELQKIVSPHRQEEALFGNSISLDGSMLAIGTENDATDVNNSNTIGLAGATYLFELDLNQNWNFWKKLVANNRTAGSFFGTQVDLINNNLIITSERDKVGSSFRNGSAHYFTISGGSIGISQALNHEDLQVYPNPFKNKVTVESSSEIRRIRIYDLQGKIIYESPIMRNVINKSILLDDLMPSLYIMQIQTLNGAHRERIVKIK